MQIEYCGDYFVGVYYRMNTETAQLTLYCPALGTTPNSIGFRNANNTDFTWYIDMRQVLGETLYKKFDMFKVFFNPITRAQSGPTQNGSLYCDGLNLRRVSENGAPQGGSALIYSCLVSAGPDTSNTVGGIPWVQWSGNDGFIMIKPDNNLINLRLYWAALGGTLNAFANNVSTFIFQFVGLKTAAPLYKAPCNYLHGLEQRNFTLSTTVLQLNGTNSYGTCNNFYSDFTFTQVPIREILGTMWDKYKKFNLILQARADGGTTSTLSGAQAVIWYFMDGFQFINTVNAGYGNVTSYNKFVTVSQNYTTGFSTPNAIADMALYDQNCQRWTFRRPESNTVNLRFQIQNLNSAGTTTALQPQWRFTFSIVGVEDAPFLSSDLI